MSGEATPTGVLVVKLGGRPAADATGLALFCRDLVSVASIHPTVLVHGGGAVLTHYARLLGLEPVFRDGIRLTTEREMPVVDMVLGGLVNTSLVRALTAAGARPVGITGADAGLIRGERESGESYTGHVASVDTALVVDLLARGYTPVVAPVSTDARGIAVNVNADEVALALAEAVAASTLLYLSDIPGVRRGEQTLRHLDGGAATALIADGTVTDGMVPKLRSCIAAVEHGVGAVIIGSFAEPGDLVALLEGRKGTRVSAGPATGGAGVSQSIQEASS